MSDTNDKEIATPADPSAAPSASGPACEVHTSGLTKMTATAGGLVAGGGAFSGLTRLYARQPVYAKDAALLEVKERWKEAVQRSAPKAELIQLRAEIGQAKEAAAKAAHVWKFGESWKHLDGKPKVVAFSLVTAVVVGAAIWGVGHHVGRCFAEQEAQRRTEGDETPTR